MGNFRNTQIVENRGCRVPFLDFDIQYSIFNIQYSILILSLLVLPTVLSAQLDAGPDVTINPGVPVTLTARYGLVAVPVNLTDNSVSPLYDIGFTFNFFGSPYSQFSIGDNGWISFDYNPAWAARRNIRIPMSPIQDPGSPQNCILGSMEDYNPGIDGAPYIFFKTVGVKPHRKLVVMWCQCPMVGCPDSTVTFQIVLKEGDTIENHILHKATCPVWDNKATLGIQKYLNSNELFASILNRNGQTWFVTPNNPEGYQYFSTSVTTYDVKPVPFRFEPITPGDKIIYRWYEGSSTEPFSRDSTVVVTPDVTTTYIVTATLCGGAIFSDTVIVIVKSPIPNAFMPNSGIPGNRIFDIIGLPPDNITKYNLQIFNRWGQIVFSSNDIEKDWDGTMMGPGGDPCPEGVYVWVIYYEDNRKTLTTNKGTITLVR
jgi:gliding motility-associated-like protein